MVRSVIMFRYSFSQDRAKTLAHSKTVVLILKFQYMLTVSAWYADTCHLLFFVCMFVYEIKEAADISYTGCQNGTKFGTLIDLALPYVNSEIGKLWPTESLWGAKIRKWVKICNTFLVHRLADRDEICHDHEHQWSAAGLKRFW